MTSNPYADLVNIPTIPTNTTSANATNIPSTSTVMITTNVESTSSLRVGHADFLSSTTTSLKNSRTLNTGFAIVCISDLRWHARRDLNPQPTVLETAALPIELLAYPTPCVSASYFVSRCETCLPHFGQNLRNSNRSEPCAFLLRVDT